MFVPVVRLIQYTYLQTYTGNILIAVNPFTKLPHLYDSHMMQQYKGAAFGELSPHPFAVADAAYRYFFFFDILDKSSSLDLFYCLHQTPLLMLQTHDK